MSLRRLDLLLEGVKDVNKTCEMRSYKSFKSYYIYV